MLSLINKNRLAEIIKPFHEKVCFTEGQFMKICSLRSKLGIPYGEAKVHKPLKDNGPPLRPILLPSGTPTFDLSKLPDPILKSITESE